ncbi:precorrin-6Y C5,15-methyltransferase (decarboxylating) [Propionicimonas paludicola]|uniref:Precorrin-6Y C5,15-methyltransferase (Decarboxylating) n=1 Tax=Propionicimonas paludicola TaxID=185243 RepID=A0A2A9CUS9_9ACTN|nr:precorrin-6Y C5,15-methyltransferase (decarboxylating) subunit CbiT [Propionicimonas paludicola]PFG17891.1 precorrin-6Y C5,15-methyltransferase (decarboxylating) [Propionicimonas paludicola]
MDDQPADLSQLSAGLPDEEFATDGLLTKRALRAYALAMLAPRAGELLWDLGAGTGSISIEWCRLRPTNRAIAVERDSERAARIGANAVRFGVTGQLDVRVAAIDAELAALPAPSAVFIGGGVTGETLERCWQRLDSGGRLVAHGVTAETEAVLAQAYRERGGELARIGVEVAEPIGRFTGFRPLRTVTSWAGTKP